MKVYARTLVAEGFAFPEGPTFDPEGNLYVVDLNSGVITRIRQDGDVGVLAHTGGRPNGAAWNSADGTLTVCDAGLAKLLSVARDGQISVLAREYEGAPFQGPNDCAYDARGNLYFTDPLGSSLETRTGKVYCRLASGEVTLFDDGYAFSNGIAFGPEGDLYVAESRTRRIHRYILSAPGKYRQKSLFVELSGGRGPDGMAFDVEGNLYIAHAGKGCIAVVSPQGRVVEEINAGGSTPTNVAFGGREGDELFITEGEMGCVYRLKVRTRGLPLH